MFKFKIRTIYYILLLFIFIQSIIPQSNIKNILLDAPFTSQAPLGEWNDPRQQDACEEASVLMAYKWYMNDKNLTKNEARAAILNMAAFQKDKYGSYHDTSAGDTATRLLKEYFGISDWEIKTIDTTDDILTEIMKENLLIIPMNGRLMNNPHFTEPAPERHMVVVIGYDMEKKDIITNDPGITIGKEYRYPLNIFYRAIRDYKTGYHQPFDKIVKKVMIVVNSPDN